MACPSERDINILVAGVLTGIFIVGFGLGFGLGAWIF